MSKPAHSRVVFEGVTGTVAAPVERWAFGINFPADAIPTDGTALVDDAVASELAGAYDTHIASQMGSDVILTKVKCSHVGANGHVALRADGSYVQGEWEGSKVGDLPPLAMPLQTALVVSLTTNRAGPTGKGRFFLPWPGYGISVSTKRLESVDAAFLAGQAKSFLNALAGITTFPPQVVSSKGYMTPVTGIRVGRVPDTMRSRREDAPEGYVDLPLA